MCMYYSLHVFLYVIQCSWWSLYLYRNYLWPLFPFLSLSAGVFAFDIYDTDADGLLTPDQVKKMFKELFGTKGMEHDATKA